VGQSTAGLAQQGEKGERDGQHQSFGLNDKNKRKSNFEFVAAGMEDFK
jgi:hypothetical protein